jgi:DNA-binding NarL/FixJ family response regulator
LAAARHRGRQADFETMLASVQSDLSQPILAENITSPTRQPSKPPVLQPSNSSALAEPLTPRELEVLQLIAEGMTNRQIAEALIISVGTAKFYTSQIYSKLNVSSRTQAVVRARELGLLA